MMKILNAIVSLLSPVSLKQNLFDKSSCFFSLFSHFSKALGICLMIFLFYLIVEISNIVKIINELMYVPCILKHSLCGPQFCEDLERYYKK